MNYPPHLAGVVRPCLVLAALFATLSTTSAAIKPEGERPSQVDVRGFDGVPKGTALLQPTAAQLKAIASLEALVNGDLVIQYNGLTATPRHIFSHSGPLTARSSAPPETIARDFLRRWRGIWRFSDADLENLRLKSRATLPEGTTVLLFEQHVDGVSVYKGEVLVNLNRAGQIISVGNDNFPELTVTNSFAISPAQAVTAAAAGLGVSSFAPQSLGTANVLRTFGDLPHEFAQGERFSGGESFSDEIIVRPLIFPLGDEGRAAYQCTLTTPQYDGMMWENIVDAQTGAILRRISLTAFEAGGGPQDSRRGVFRPDIQQMIEAISATTGSAKVFDSAPTPMSGGNAFGRPTRAQLPRQPGYAPDNSTTGDARGFRRGLLFERTHFPFAEVGTSLFAEVYNTPFGQVTRGIPNALSPTPESPLGWFYLPTDAGGAEITSGDPNRAATRAFGYNTMNAAAKTRNQVNAGNSPTGDGSQPFSATLTDIPDLTVPDGRTLSLVFESNYTEGNNVMTLDDKQGDNETTHGIRGYNPNRQFVAPYFTFASTYEIDGTAEPDVFPGTLSLFFFNNLIHDYLYSIGFTEATWNFQQDNFGKGGAGADAVATDVQDGSGNNNANFSTPSDGSRPRMQMFLWTDASTRRAAGDFDFELIAHEHYHGVSNRSVGKGETGCLGNPFVGESGGMGEGWGDYIGASFTDDDGWAEYVTGDYDRGLRKFPMTNFRYSYGNLNGSHRRRDQLPPDTSDTAIYIPFETHDVGEMWAATLWDMRELLIMKQDVDNDPAPTATNFAGKFFDGSRRLGGGATFYIGYRQVQSMDANHPIDYRASFNNGNIASINPTAHIVRPGDVAAEAHSRGGDRNGPLATAIARGARLADRLVLRAMQLAPCNPSFVEMRDSILLADNEINAGENRAVIWRAFASHGVGVAARSTAGTGDDPATQGPPVIVEDFTVPAGVTQCEVDGPLAPPQFSLSNPDNNEVLVTITPRAGAASYVVSRATSAAGPFVKIAELPHTNTQIVYPDDNGGEGLVLGQTYFYQVRATRSADCVSDGNVQSILITAGEALQPAPLFLGVAQVIDPRLRDRLILSWFPATTVNPTPNIVYDIYRVSEVNHGTGIADPTFTPSESNRITPPGGVTGTSYVDTGLTLNQVYYYIVQARDLSNGKRDTNNTGNTSTKWNAPTITCVLGSPFALETFEAPPATPTPTPSRFAPALTESGTNPNQASPTFQRIAVAGLGHPSVGKMYAPNYSPGHEANGCTPDPGTHCGAQSDFFTQIGPIPGPNQSNPQLNTPALTATSIMEFDQMIVTEDRFDGGVIEIKVGAPFGPGDAPPGPTNNVIFDLGDYMIEGGYNSKLDGMIEGTAPGTALFGRRAFSGIKPLHHTRISLRSFAPGGVHNPQSLPVFIRFREVSDPATAVGVDAGWFIDNLVIHNLGTNGAIPLRDVVSRKTHGQAGTFDVSLPISGTTKGIEPRTGGANGDHTVVFKFGAALTAVGNATVTGGGSVKSQSYDQTSQEVTVNLTGVPNAREIIVTLTGLSDTCGNTGVNIPVTMGVLAGDTTADRFTDAGDVNQTKKRSGEAITTSNFRSDVTADGFLDAGDISAVKSKSGTALPAQ